MNKQLDKIEKLCKECFGMCTFCTEDGEQELSFRELITLDTSAQIYAEFWDFLTLLRGDKTSAGAEDVVLAQRIQDEIEEYRELYPAQSVPRTESRKLAPVQKAIEKEAKKEEKEAKKTAEMKAAAEATKKAAKEWRKVKWREARQAFDNDQRVYLIYPDTKEMYIVEDMSRDAVYIKETPKDRQQVRLALGAELVETGEGFSYSLTDETCYLAIAN